MKLSLFNSAIIAVIFTAQASEAIRMEQAQTTDMAGIFGTDLVNAAQTFAETNSEICPKCEAAKAKALAQSVAQTNQAVESARAAGGSKLKHALEAQTAVQTQVKAAAEVKA